MEWIESLPHYIQDEDTLITHAPLCPMVSLADACEYSKLSYRGLYDCRADCSITWNRIPPSPKEKFQIYGHNGYLKKHFIDPKKTDNPADMYAICIDSTRSGFLSAIVLPERTVIVEEI
jgi:hypothetical protein